jgi:putative ABC transport system substrate-binding protein
MSETVTPLKFSDEGEQGSEADERSGEAPERATDAQQRSTVPRIGYLEFGTAAPGTPLFEAFRQGLRDLGWVDGQNIAIEVRYADGKRDQLPELAAGLVRSKVDLIFTSTTAAALAAKHATTTIPIVIGFVGDPVGSGVVASLARPEGNITGWTHLAGLELAGERLELMKEAVPGVTRPRLRGAGSSAHRGPCGGC